METAVERAVQAMWDRYDEPLTLDDLADCAILSRFHFSRVFNKVTGTSPGRFLAAIRISKAKNLLLKTSLSVTDISYRVGYNSLGTFTSRFTRSVGMPPVRYRYLSHAGIPRVPSVHPVEPWLCGRVCGTLNQPYSETRTRIYIGAFESPIPQGQPVSCCVLDSGGPYRLGGVPPGDWFVLAMAVAVENVDVEPWARRPLYVSAIKPIVSTPGRLLRHDIDMHPTRSVDLPILLALPELDSVEVPGLACRAAL